MPSQALGDVRQRALEETRAAAASRAQAESAASAARADARAARDELARLQVRLCRWCTSSQCCRASLHMMCVALQAGLPPGTACLLT